MKKIAAYILPILAGVSACDGGSSTVYPSDNRDSSPVNNTDSNAYSGRVMDGYLRNAFVWLDLDDDLQVDYCERGIVKDDQNNDVVAKVDDSCEDEPSAYSSENGKYTLDLSAIQAGRVSRGESPLDPRKYGVVALAIPGITIDESEVVDGNDTLGLIDRPYFLMGAPNNAIVSPLTTLIKARLDAITGHLVVDNDVIEIAYNSVRNTIARGDNLQIDYVQSNDLKMSKYAEGIRHLIQAHTPETLDFNPGALDKDELFKRLSQGFNNPYAEVMNNAISRATLSLVKDMMDQIDVAAGESPTDADYEAVDIAQDVEITTLDLVFENPYVLVQEETEKNPVLDSNGFLADLSQVVGTADKVSTRLTYQWSTNGKLAAIEVDGCRELLGLPSEVMSRRVAPLVDETAFYYENTARYCGVDDLIDQKLVYNYEDGIHVTQTRYEVTVDGETGENVATPISTDALDAEVSRSVEGDLLSNVTVQLSPVVREQLDVSYEVDLDTFANVGTALVRYIETVDSGGEMSEVVTDLPEQTYVLEYELLTDDEGENSYRLASQRFTQIAGEKSQSYIWVYSYHDETDGELNGLLDSKVLYKAGSNGEPRTGEGQLALTRYTYKHLLDTVFE